MILQAVARQAAVVGVGVLLILVHCPRHGAAEDPGPTLQSLPPLNRQQMQAELERLEQICRRLAMESQAELSRQWLAAERTDQHRFYLPAELPPEPDDPRVAHWRNRFLSARRQYAAHLFDQARIQADQDQEATAYRLLWQVLREDPGHAEALRVLGSLATALTVRPQQRSGGAAGELTQLANGPLQRWQTRNFQLLSRAPAKDSIALANQLERFFAIWTQCFYELWAPPGVLQDRLRGGNTSWPEPQRAEVVLLADREEYLRLLGQAEQQIDRSIGYYHPQTKRSFFYAANQHPETVHHELTHQLLAETARLAPPGPLAQAPGAWCIEGIALYMESLTQSTEGWTLGGIESPRLQTARFRALRDQYWPLWEPFCQSSIDDWKWSDANFDVALAYAHAAGLTHLFMDLLPDQPAGRQAYLRYLAGIYSGGAQPAELLRLLGEHEQAAQTRFRQLMTVTDHQLGRLADSGADVRQLVLSRSQLEDWPLLSRFPNLQWLDVSFSNLAPDQTQWLGELRRLKRLSVEGTRLAGEILPTVAALEELEELDLSLCAIDDQALSALAGHPRLETLWLSGTRVTEAALETLASLPRLKFCDVSATRVDPDRWRQFLEAHPQLRGSQASRQP